MNQRIISLISQNGDAGKSMIAIALAAELAKTHKVLLMDRDVVNTEFGYSASLAARRRTARHPDKPPFNVTLALTKKQANACFARQDDYFIIDSPSHDHDEIPNLALGSELIIIPISCSEKGVNFARRVIFCLITIGIDPRSFCLIFNRVHTEAEHYKWHQRLHAMLAKDQRENPHLPLALSGLTLHPYLRELAAYQLCGDHGLAITESRSLAVAKEARAAIRSICAQLHALPDIHIYEPDEQAAKILQFRSMFQRLTQEQS